MFTEEAIVVSSSNTKSFYDLSLTFLVDVKVRGVFNTFSRRHLFKV